MPQDKQQQQKAKLDFTKIKNFCTSKDITKRGQRQPTEWSQMSANHTSDKGLVFRIYKEVLQLNNKKTNNPI